MNDNQNQNDELIDYIHKLKIIFGHLNNVKRDCGKKHYTLSEDEMNWIWHCRDLAFIVLHRYNKIEPMESKDGAS